MPAPGEPAATGSVLIPFSSGRPMQGQVVTLSRTGYRIPIGANWSFALGIYGVIAYGVVQRTRELGIRMALGARSDDVLRLVLRQGMAPVVAGLVLGLGGAAAASRVLRGLLYGVGGTDPITYVGVAAFLAAVALLASYLPARRAALADPVVALRNE